MTHDIGDGTEVRLGLGPVRPRRGAARAVGAGAWVGARRLGATLLVGATLVIGGRLALGQAPPEIPHAPPSLPLAPPQISPDCQTPGLAISGAVPLPNLVEALKTRKVIRILSIGASYRGLGRGGEYFSLIEHALEQQASDVDVQIIDRGVSGELARDAGQRLRVEVALTSPDLVIWQVGTNDAMAHIPVEDFAASVRDTVRWLKDNRVDVALVGLHYIRNLKQDPTYQATRKALSEISREEQVLRIGRYEAGQVIDQIRSSKARGEANIFELTESGYVCLAEYVVRALSSGLFARTPAARKPPM